MTPLLRMILNNALNVMLHTDMLIFNSIFNKTTTVWRLRNLWRLWEKHAIHVIAPLAISMA